MIDVDGIMSSIEASWSIRTERLPHAHIFQVNKPEPGCPACEKINPSHMVPGYGLQWISRKNGGYAP